jgi:DNA-binding MltR family transcriptional regulator
MERGNKMLQSLQNETPRGQACVGDALLDEALKEMFEKRLIASKQSKELLNYTQPLGSHGARLRMAYAVGWLGPLTYKTIDLIHKTRNRMAHDLDAEKFDDPQVRDLVDSIDTVEFLPSDLSGVKFPILKDKFMIAVQYSLMQLWALMDESVQVPVGTDRPLVSLRSAKTDGTGGS